MNHNPGIQDVVQDFQQRKFVCRIGIQKHNVSAAHRCFIGLPERADFARTGVGTCTKEYGGHGPVHSTWKEPWSLPESSTVWNLRCRLRDTRNDPCHSRLGCAAPILPPGVLCSATEFSF